ncbi:MAG: hypothetical protein ABIG11_06190 [bacterium]
MGHHDIDLILAKALASLPDRRPSPAFNSRVMKALRLEIYASKAEKVFALIEICWLAGVFFIITSLFFAHLTDILLICLQPGILLSGLKFYALKTWTAGTGIISLLSKTGGILSSLIAGSDILRDLAVSSILAGIVITAVSKPAYPVKSH